MKKIIVTGGFGQLGQALQEAVNVSENHYIFTSSDTLNICDKEAVFAFCSTHKADVILNCAAYTNVDGAEADVVAAEKVNHHAVQGLAEVSKELGITLIHISTDYVFGGTANEPYQEDIPTQPLGIYGATKRRGEEAILASGCDYLIFRTAWLYAQKGKNFLNTMLHLTSSKEVIQVVFDQVGTPTNAADLAHFLVTIIDNNTYQAHQGIYHYTNEGVCSWFDFAWAINELAGNTCKVKPCYSSQFPSVVRRPSYSVLDKTKVKATFSVEIPYWRDSLVKCIKKIKNENV